MNIFERDSVHKTKSVSGFSSKCGLDRLIYFEEHADILGAIERDKQIKSWLREKKLVLIESLNPKMAAFEHSLEPPREPADFGQIASR